MPASGMGCCQESTREQTEPCGLGRVSSLSFTISWSLFKLMSVELVMPSNHLIFYCSLLLLPSIFPNIRSFPASWLCIRWPTYWSFTFSISPANEYSGLVSKGLSRVFFQHHSLKASILQHSAFFYGPTLIPTHDYLKNQFFFSAIRVMSSAYLRLLIFLQAILIPACASSSPAFCKMHSEYKLNKQSDDIQP